MVRKFRRKDSLEIIAIKKECIVHRLFTIAKNEKGYFVICSSNNWEKAIYLSETDVNYKVSVTENMFACKYLIPWKFLDVNIQTDRIVPFNICAVITNPDNVSDNRTCNIFNKGQNFWDFRGVGSIEYEN